MIHAEEEDLGDYQTIDDFASQTGLSTRTIRFYQARGLLEAPRKRGRIALYGPPHRERIRFIEELQSRGLTLRAIKDLARGQRGDNTSLEQWLGIDRMREHWSTDRPTLMSRAQLEQFVGDGDAGQIGRLLEAGAIQMDEQDGSRRYRVSPILVGCALELQRAGVSLEVSTGVHGIIETHFVAAAREVVSFLYARRGCGFGDSDLPEDVERAIQAIFPEGGSPFVQLIFAQAVDKAVGEWLEADGLKQIARKTRKKKRRGELKRDKVKRSNRRRRKREEAD